jgi:hypothetical protein
VDFKGAVVHVGSGVAADEEAVVVDVFGTEVDVGEEGDVGALVVFFFDVEEVAGDEVEVGCVECD